MRLPVVDQSLTLPGVRAGFETGPKSIGAVRVLRISVTDRCNFRCLYCMPEEGVRWLPREEILGFEEICDVVRSAVEVHGIRRFKLTGGEPTVRHGLVDLVAMLRRIPGVEDLSLTTNGQRLTELAGPLREAGLDRVTVSIDSLRPERFRRITRTGDLALVLRGLDRCEEVEFPSLKINVVTMRGTNDDELADFARLSLTRKLTMRFIEYMPLGDAALLHLDGTGGAPESAAHGRGAHATVATDEIGPAGGCGAQDRGSESLIPEAEVRGRIENELGPLLPVDRGSEPGVGPANVYRLALGTPRGRIGFISAMSAPFCATCNRLRLTANGVLRSCLFEGGEVDIRPMLRSARDAGPRRLAVAQAMADCVRLKPDVHSRHGNEQMSRIGG
ncbi:MAG: molybdenum cofactor biosynthesis protein [Phycisphaerales bacterium]|nr:molybdenum cofactor biosynthesis protein [Phycisphaerales bacterium]